MRLPINTEKYRVTSRFGNRDNPLNPGKVQFHDGLDLVSDVDRKVFALCDCKVIYDMDDYNENLRWISDHHSAGNMFVVNFKVDNKIVYVRYLHLLKNEVSVNQNLKEGDYIGEYADVGRSRGAHLHIDMYDINWKLLNIEEFFIKNGVKV